MRAPCQSNLLLGLIVHVTLEDLAHWARSPRPGSRIYYEPVPRIAGVVLSAAGALELFLDQDMHCQVSTEKSGQGRRRTHIRLEQINRKLAGEPHRLRLRIEKIDDSQTPPRVTLAEYDDTKTEG